jgi:hypothetical protein
VSKRLFLGGIAVLRGMSGEIGIRVAGNILIGFCGNRGEGIEGGKDVVSEETLSEARDYVVASETSGRAVRLVTFSSC